MNNNQDKLKSFKLTFKENWFNDSMFTTKVEVISKPVKTKEGYKYEVKYV